MGAEGPAGLSLVRDGRSARVARAQLRFIFATHRSLSFSQIQRGEGGLGGGNACSDATDDLLCGFRQAVGRSCQF